MALILLNTCLFGAEMLSLTQFHFPYSSSYISFCHVPFVSYVRSFAQHTQLMDENLYAYKIR